MSVPFEPKDDSIALLFSGGLDTTLEAVDRAKAYSVVHLVTFDNGRCVNIGAAKKRADNLQSALPDCRFRHELVNTSPLIRKLVEGKKTELASYRSPLTFDLACKMAGVIMLIHYAKKNGVEYLSDGSSIDQTQIFLQHPDFSKHIRPLFQHYNLKFAPPVHFGKSRHEKLAMLSKMDLPRGVCHLEKLHITSQIAHQPFCLQGFLTYFFTSPLRSFPLIRELSLPLNSAMNAWDELLPLALSWLDENLGEK